ncbi:cyclin-B1-2-like isoform X1 [Cicer arietinum]|uniref:Cyclin-B1-2-like isoform X1 n=1 Tax=Cicer arietinum TaxID=3827 RepID=A0A1S3EA05_CICAR|nr:cyclin-B1-2-like isoform X1 [Cicer arietinum]
MEDTSKTIAHQIGGLQNDALRFGLHGVKSDIVGSHPLESSLQSVKGAEEAMKRQCKVNLYGAAFPLKEELDRQILSRFQRPPGVIPSSMLGLESVTGSLDHFGFEDFLNGIRIHDKELCMDGWVHWQMVLCCCWYLSLNVVNVACRPP